jgi:hypothetical protein
MKRKPPRRRRACVKRVLRTLAAEKNERWSMDFMSDQLYDGQRIRLLTLVDKPSGACYIPAGVQPSFNVTRHRLAERGIFKQ